MKHWRCSFLLITILALLFFCTAIASAAVIYVSKAGNDSNNGYTWATAKLTIQAGLEATGGAYDEMWVAQGTYNEHITIADGVALYGGFIGTEVSRDQRCWKEYEVIINGGGTGRTVYFDDGSSTNSRIDGFTITGGNAGGGGGGGIYCNSISPTITNNCIHNNTASLGGGLYFAYSEAVVCNNKINSNTSTSLGGGIYITYADPVICNNFIYSNTANSNGGGIYNNRTEAIIKNNTIANNIASSGGGVYCTSNGANPTIVNNVIADNTANVAGGGIRNYESSPVLGYNCVFNNTGGDYSGISTGIGDISEDPLFISIGGHDYRMLPTSPCIDSGDDTFAEVWEKDYDGQRRIQGPHVDIGADEYPKWGWNYERDYLLGISTNGKLLWNMDITVWSIGTGSLVSASPCDIEGDGTVDIIGINPANMVFYTFTGTSWINIPGLLTNIVVADLNGNGTDDIAGINASGKIFYTLNNGTSWVAMPGTLASIYKADLNNDGRRDIVGINPSGSIFYSQNKLGWSNMPFIHIASQLAIGDFNGDQTDDVACLTTKGKIYYTTNKGNSWVNIPGTLNKLAAGDFDGDGVDDVAGLTSAGKIYYTTDKAGWINVPGTLVTLVTGDFNGDGKDDIIGKNSSGKVCYTLDRAHWATMSGTVANVFSVR